MPVMTNAELLAYHVSQKEEDVNIPLTRLEIEQLRREREDDELIIEDADAELQAAKALHKATVTGPRARRAKALKEIRSRERIQKCTVYEVDNQDSGMMEKYVQGDDGCAIFISSRRLTQAERQGRILNLSHEGTNG